MKFLTRQRYQAIQKDSRKAERDWERAGADYSSHLRAIRKQLPESSQRLCDLTFHDGVVKALRQPSRGTARLIIDASNNPWGPCGWFELRFQGVEAVRTRGQVVADWWLYEEFHLADGGFALHVLLQRSSLVIVASEVTCRALRKSG